MLRNLTGILSFPRGQTEIIHKNRHPQWTTTFSIDYEYGSESFFSVAVYRAKGKDYEDPISYGTATCEVGDILGSKNRTKVKRLPGGKNIRVISVETALTLAIEDWGFTSFCWCSTYFACREKAA